VVCTSEIATYRFCGGQTGCAPCETCGPLGTCVSAPHPTCRAPAGSGDTTLKLTNTARSKQVVWESVGQISGSLPDVIAQIFGNPADATTGHDYELCLYDSTDSLQFRASVPAAGLCGVRPCWMPLVRDGLFLEGYDYRDRERTPEGVKRVRLRSRSRTTMVLRGSGDLLVGRQFGLPVGPLATPIRAQLQVRDGECWEATFSAPTINDAERFRARSD